MTIYVLSFHSRRVLLILNMSILHKGADVGNKIGQPTFLQNSLDNFVVEPLAQIIDLTVSPEVVASENPLAEANHTDAKVDFATVAEITARIEAEIGTDIEATVDEAILPCPTIEIVRPSILPLAGLTPYRNKWMIKVRVTSKSTIKSWKNAKGEGRLFNFDVMDASGEMHCVTCHIDKFYEMIQVSRNKINIDLFLNWFLVSINFKVDKVYFLSKAYLKPANKSFTTAKNDFEMHINEDTIVEECTEYDDNIPAIQYSFVPIQQILNVDAHANFGTLNF